METITLQVSETDYTIILGALREAPAAIEDWELRIRVGGTSEEITRVSLKIREQGERQGAVE
jgi:hypothetical protein